MTQKQQQFMAGAVGVLLCVGTACGVACLVRGTGAPSVSDAATDDAGVFAGPSFPFFGALPPPDADLRDRFHWCKGWSGGSAPAGTVYYGASIYIDPDSTADTKTGNIPSDAGVTTKYGLLVVGIPPNDGGFVAEIKQHLAAAGMHPVEDNGVRRLAGAPATESWMAPGGCEMYLWLTEATDVPVSAAVTCAAGPGCWVSRKKTWGIDGGFTTGIANMTFQPGTWKYPDAGAGHVCVPKVCAELAGSHSMPKECQ